MSDKIRCSVIIPSYNSEATIVACLDSVLAQDFAGTYEVIVVDSSADRTPQLIREQFPSVTLISLPRRTDPGTARNLGVARSSGDIVAFLDSDCRAAPDWLRHTIAGHQAGYEVVGGAVENGNPQSLVGWAGYMAEFREFLPHGLRRQVAHIPTCNISYRRQVFERYGGFSSEHYPQEDLVYNLNLKRNGVPILFDPAIRVAHTNRSQMGDYFRHQRRIGRITAQVLKLADLPGAFFVRRPWLAPLFIPFLPFIKFTRTCARFLRINPRPLLRRPLVFPLFFMGLLYWLVGFVEGVYSGRKADSEQQLMTRPGFNGVS